MRVDMKMTGLSGLEGFFAGQLRELQPKLKREMTIIGTRWQLEAKQRVPVDTGLLRNTIIKETGSDSEGQYVKVGSNQLYAKFVEFGTKWIAGGRVQALGTSQEITDSQVIKLWPAKNENLVSNKTGKAYKAAGRLAAHVSGGGQQEQMPWLRTSLNAIRHWATDRLIGVFKFDA